MARQVPKQWSLTGRILVLLPVLGFALGATTVRAVVPAADAGQPASANGALSAETDDVIATVGDQTIRFTQLTQELDQGAAAGVPLPGSGTPERTRILKRMLDEKIRTDLLYLDALRKGVDQDPGFQRQLKRFKEGALAGLYRDRLAHQGQQMEPEVLREGISIQINADALDPARDSVRKDDEVLVTAGDATITWGDAKPRLLVVTRRAARTEGAMDVAVERRNVLEQLTDVTVTALRAREAGLDQDPGYLRRLADFSRTDLAGFHARQLALGMSPSSEEVEAYAHEQGETIAPADDTARRAMEGALIQQRLQEYLDRLADDAFPVAVDEHKLDRLLADEAKRHPATAEGAPPE